VEMMEATDICPIKENRSIEIPLELRHISGFRNEFTLYFLSVKSEYYSRIDLSRNIKRTELKVVISPIDPEAWGRVYRLEFLISDDPGSLSTLLELLSTEGVVILGASIRPYLTGERARCALSVWFKEFIGTIDDLNKHIAELVKQNPSLRGRMKPISIFDTHETWVYGTPLSLQKYAYPREFAPGISGKPGSDFPLYLPSAQRATTMRDGCITIPQSIIDRVDEQFGLPSDRYRSVAGDGCVLATANSINETLTLRFYHPHAKIVKMQFHVKNKPGTIANISRFLSDRNVRILEAKVTTPIFSQYSTFQIIADFADTFYRGFSPNWFASAMLKDLTTKNLNLNFYSTRRPVEVLAFFGQPDEVLGRSYEIVKDLEDTLRKFIENQLREKYETAWWELGIPSVVKQEVEERRRGELKKYREQSMAYVGFSDYIDIITKKDNWKAIFKKVFQDKHNVITALKNLVPIHNKIVHSVSISQDEYDKLQQLANDFHKVISATTRVAQAKRQK
jgi:ACT domain-containing protein